MLPLKSFQPMRLLSDTQVYPLLFLFFAFSCFIYYMLSKHFCQDNNNEDV